MAHGDITRQEYKVRIRTDLGTIITEWALTEERVEVLRTKYNVVSVEWTTHVLDY